MMRRAGGRMALSILAGGSLVLGLASIPSPRASADVFSFGIGAFFPHAFGRHSGLGISIFSSGPYGYYTRHRYYRPYAPVYYDPWWGPPPVVIVRDDRRPPRRHDDSDDYYLNRRPGSRPDAALIDAVTDIEDAFRKSDAVLLEKHVHPDDTVTIQSRDRKDRKISGKEYVDLTQDAFKEMKTVRYSLGRPEAGKDGTWVVRGTHVVRDDDDKERTYDVTVVLQKRDGVWVIQDVRAIPAD